MSQGPLVVVYPPDEDGGRRVRAGGEILGRAYNLRDLVEFLRRAGLDDWDENDAYTSGLIDWRGPGPDAWPTTGPQGPPGP
ncbi:hypothetical protein PV728_29455 [Streptomyces europaeiscabiei]|uniref:hypothetical protein n=1 Tax=Streptomyces europaeiscabiei TaxID=146819 RepID=UPI0029AAB7F0|nr:hypothetical protein [Streptomyces europaeiscabiei]MDX3634318.1 hypothetical protein [Streptomyces europaeiscabiei]MDX3651834.1 hypothetical protein [Streptomyces europaeiscabiei]